MLMPAKIAKYIKNTMCYHVLKDMVCDKHSCHQGRKSLNAIKNWKFLRLGCSRCNLVLKDEVFCQAS